MFVRPDEEADRAAVVTPARQDTGYSERLEASLNALLVHYLLERAPGPLRRFRVVQEGDLIRLTLSIIRGPFEDRLRRTPQGRAALACWERDLLVDLGPMIWTAVEEHTGEAVLGGFEVVTGEDGDPTLLLELEPRRRTDRVGA